MSSDVLMFFPAVFYFIVVYYSGSRTGRKSDWAWHIAMILLNPCLILIDHGHFQVLNEIFLLPAASPNVSDLL